MWVVPQNGSLSRHTLFLKGMEGWKERWRSLEEEEEEQKQKKKETVKEVQVEKKQKKIVPVPALQDNMQNMT